MIYRTMCIEMASRLDLWKLIKRVFKKIKKFYLCEFYSEFLNCLTEKIAFHKSKKVIK